ncbi:hypothetical protein CB0940_02547 [Cercospora beticola]|uniref:Uncharacterized protein n=1 Tax=Cercospora beticola TaxID=122368 RepID=A0A2G5I445_CERBT|nr:hypothetical protein CB0940_02547 [Cercospora beticola]PIA99263.1 hypothetical protein CB0940_02547 [Cercospora beticola]WPA99685.1 hypothetical protein RHO25_004303 [Cercospora beticola]CAK1362169.1 unnamed protein product [Cercospora beticola]
MLFSAATTAIALLASTVAAVPASLTIMADNPNLEISQLVVSSSATGNTLLQFNVKNPEPLAAKGTAVCRGEWDSVKKDWPISGKALRCDKSQSVTWYIDSWTDATNFVIAIQDRFKDHSIGEPPYDRMTTFSKATINASVVSYDNQDEKPDASQGTTSGTNAAGTKAGTGTGTGTGTNAGAGATANAPVDTQAKGSSDSVSGTQMPDTIIYAAVYAVSA